VRRSVAVALFGVCVATVAGLGVRPSPSLATPPVPGRVGGDDISAGNLAATAPIALPGGAVAPRPAPVSPPGRVLVLGDSIPHSLGPTLAAVAAEHGVSLHNGAISGCSMIDGVTSGRDGLHFPWSLGCAEAIAGYEQRMIADYQPDVVVWMSAWETSNRTLDDGALVWPGTRNGNLRLLAEIDEAAGRLRAGGARLVLVLLAPVPQGFEASTSDTTLDRLPYLNAMLEDYARRHADGVSVVYMSEFLCPNGPPCPAELGGLVPRPDGVHFDDPAGARWAAEQLVPRIMAPMLPGEPATWTYVGVGRV
jgi:hypothetical protein